MYNAKMMMDPDVAKSLRKSEVELEKTTMEELRKQMPKIIQLVYQERQAKHPKGRGKHIYEKPKIWPDHIPFQDPNNKRNGTRPMKHDVLAMFKHLIKLYKEQAIVNETVNAAQPGGMSQKVIYEESGESYELKYEPYLTKPPPEYSQDISIQPKVKPTNELGPKLEDIPVGNTDIMIDMLKSMASSTPKVIESWTTKIHKIEEFLGTDIGIYANDLSVLAKQAILLKNLSVSFDTNLEKIHTHCLTQEKDLLSIATELLGLDDGNGDLVDQQDSPNCHSMEVDDQVVTDENTTNPVIEFEPPKLEQYTEDVSEQKKKAAFDIYSETTVLHNFQLENVDSGTAKQLNQMVDEINQLNATGDFDCVSSQNKDLDIVASTIDKTQLENLGITTRSQMELPQEPLTLKFQQVKAADPKHMLAINPQEMLASDLTIIQPPYQTTANMTTEKYQQVFQPANQVAKTGFPLDLDELEKLFAPTEDLASPILFNSNNTLSVPTKQLFPTPPRNMCTEEQTQMVTSYSGRGKRSHTDTDAPRKVPKIENEDVHGYAESSPNIPTFIQEEHVC